jgi:exodeoxyribonuclease-3
MIKIISWNTNGLRATMKQGNLLPLFSTYEPDILCLQETKSEITQLDNMTKYIDGYNSYFTASQTRKGYSGVGVYVKKNVEKKYKLEKIEYELGTKSDLDLEGRTLILYFKNFVIINCYFPNGGQGPHRLEYKLRFYDAFLKKCEALRKKGYSIIFCGDVNTAHTEIDLARPKENVDNTGFLPIERAWIDKLIQKKYIDTFRYFYPDIKDTYTYWDQKTRARDRNVGWRIDYFFVSEDLNKNIKDSYMLTDYSGSDHCPIVLDISL